MRVDVYSVLGGLIHDSHSGVLSSFSDYQSLLLMCVGLLVFVSAPFLYRYVILPKDFEKGWKAHVRKHERDFEFYSF